MTTLTIPAEEAKASISLEAGVYRATVKSLESVDGQYGPQAKFVFELDGLNLEDGSPASLWAWASWKLNPATKLHRWVLALGGERPVPGHQYNLSKVIGTRCRLLIENKETEDGTRARVREVLPLVKAAKPTAPTDGTCVECGEQVVVYGPDGTGYCETHAPQE